LQVTLRCSAGCKWPTGRTLPNSDLNVTFWSFFGLNHLKIWIYDFCQNNIYVFFSNSLSTLHNYKSITANNGYKIINGNNINNSYKNSNSINDSSNNKRSLKITTAATASKTQYHKQQQQHQCQLHKQHQRLLSI